MLHKGKRWYVDFYILDPASNTMRRKKYMLSRYKKVKAKNEMEGKTATLTPSEFTWYPQTEFCFMRGGRAFLAAKGGNNAESHNHNDVGTEQGQELRAVPDRDRHTPYLYI